MHTKVALLCNQKAASASTILAVLLTEDGLLKEIREPLMAFLSQSQELCELAAIQHQNIAEQLMIRLQGPEEASVTLEEFDKECDRIDKELGR